MVAISKKRAIEGLGIRRKVTMLPSDRSRIPMIVHTEQLWIVALPRTRLERASNAPRRAASPFSWSRKCIQSGEGVSVQINHLCMVDALCIRSDTVEPVFRCFPQQN